MSKSFKDSCDPATIEVGLVERPTTNCLAALPISCTIEFCPAHATHYRRPSTLDQGIPIKDGVSIPRNNVGATKTGSVISSGSIDDTSAPISPSPAATPAIKSSSEGVKSFGSVPAAVGQINGKFSVSSSTKPPLSQTSSSTSTIAPTKPKVIVQIMLLNVEAELEMADEHGSLMDRVTVGAVSASLDQATKSIDPSDYLGTLFRDPTSSHLETVLSRASAKPFALIWNTYLQGKLP
ncbi:hypothetical protein F5879DRAFT_994403 [Lentinula edodes]|nr:hypothetical protein F5879DRAFT_994403 [Lentinula edodes]